MSHELFWLIMTAAMTGLMWIPYTLDRIIVRGLPATMANPSPNDKPQSPWTQRLMAAHRNAVENLVIFAPLVLATQDLNVNLATPTTTFACQLYFWSRLAHAAVYTAGIPVLRTLAFTGGFVAQLMLVLALFKLA
ncbi:MAG: MAPEG family protein [Xanthobacteraceae bacterium]